MVAHEGSNWRGVWLRGQRKALPAPKGKWVTQEEMADRLNAVGIEVERTEYNKLENGRKPFTDELLVQLAGHFGVPVPTAPEPPQSDMAQLIAAISALVTEMREARLEQADWSAGVQDVLARLADRVPSSPKGGRARETLSGAPR